MFVFIRGNRADRGEARLESGVPRFYLNHDDGFASDRDYVCLESFCSPIADEYDHSVFLQEVAGNAFTPPTA